MLDAAGIVAGVELGSQLPDFLSAFTVYYRVLVDVAYKSTPELAGEFLPKI